MRYRTVITFILTIISFTAFSQTTNKSEIAGKYRFIQYADNVIKIIFQPVNYSKNECISNAVLAKPYLNLSNQSTTEFTNKGKASILFKNNILKLDNGTISINNSAVFRLDSMFNKNGYRGFNFKLSAEEKKIGRAT